MSWKRDFAALWVFHVAVTGRGTSGDRGGECWILWDGVEEREVKKKPPKKSSQSQKNASETAKRLPCSYK